MNKNNKLNQIWKEYESIKCQESVKLLKKIQISYLGITEEEYDIMMNEITTFMEEYSNSKEDSLLPVEDYNTINEKIQKIKSEAQWKHKIDNFQKLKTKFKKFFHIK